MRITLTVRKTTLAGVTLARLSVTSRRTGCEEDVALIKMGGNRWCALHIQTRPLREDVMQMDELESHDDGVVRVDHAFVAG